MYIFNGGRVAFFAGSSQNPGPGRSSWIRWFAAKNAGKRIIVAKVSSLWRGEQRDTSPKCRKACGQVMMDSKMPAKNISLDV